MATAMGQEGRSQDMELQNKEEQKSLTDSIAAPSLDLYDAYEEGRIELPLYETFPLREDKLEHVDELEEALQADEEDIILLGEALELYGILGERASLKKTANQLSSLGAYSTYKTYYELVSGSLSDKDILITNGVGDTRPMLMKQAHDNGEHHILRLSWRQQSGLEQALESQGITLPSPGLADGQYILQLAALNPDKHVRLSPTLSQDLLASFGTALHTDGPFFCLNQSKAEDNTSSYEQIRAELKATTKTQLEGAAVNLLPFLRNACLDYTARGKSRKADEITRIIEDILEVNDINMSAQELIDLQ